MRRPISKVPPESSDYGLVVRPITKGELSSVARINDTLVSTVFREANLFRASLTIVNDSSAALYVLKANGTASPTNYSYRLEQYSTLEILDYIGRVTGVWAADPNDGGAQITEIIMVAR